MGPFRASVILLAVIFLAQPALAQTALEKEPRRAPSTDVLTAEQWKQLDESVERALEWLVTKQKSDGSFKSIDMGQPAITSLSLMAFLAQGESPVDGQYQAQLKKAVDFIAAQQKANGLIALDAPNGVPIPRQTGPGTHIELGVTIVYNHAISSLALCEAYGQCGPEQSEKLAPVIEKAIAATLEMQGWGGKRKENVGGWRYIYKRFSIDSDLSVTGWQLLFLRSAKSAGFDVPKKSIEAAVAYIERSFLKRADRQVHAYQMQVHSQCTRAMAGAGVLALAHAGKHDSKEAAASAEWILAHDFSLYNGDKPPYGSWLNDRYHYGALQCTQAMYQLGGKYWEKFFPPLVDTLLANQQADGSWSPEKMEQQYGNCYTTSLTVLSLSVPNQILPIFQR